jgi:hypothetical protein
MRCDTAREWIVLDLYEELAPWEGAALRDHLEACAACAAAADDERRLLALLGADAQAEPGADLLEACRKRLRSTLARAAPAGTAADGAGAAPEGLRPEAARPDGVRPVGVRPEERGLPWWWRFRPAAALAAMLVTGFLLGRLAPSGGAPAPPGIGPEAAPADTFSGVSDLLADPGGDRVSVHYDVLRRATLEGSASDPEIRRLLVETARASLNAGLRLEALAALRGQADRDDVRDALLLAVSEDENPGARLKAIEALAGRAGGDPRVRDVLVRALVGDGNPGVRVRALEALEGTRHPEVLPVFERLSREDPNDYVRLRAAAYVSHAGGAGGGR